MNGSNHTYTYNKMVWFHIHIWFLSDAFFTQNGVCKVDMRGISFYFKVHQNSSEQHQECYSKSLDCSSQGWPRKSMTRMIFNVFSLDWTTHKLKNKFGNKMLYILTKAMAFTIGWETKPFPTTSPLPYTTFTIPFGKPGNIRIKDL